MPGAMEEDGERTPLIRNNHDTDTTSAVFRVKSAMLTSSCFVYILVMSLFKLFVLIL